MRPFRYLRDPLFLFAVAAFLVNRYVLERTWSSGFVHNHVNDLLCVAFLVPVMLTLMKCCGLRRFDGAPRTVEIVIPVLVWSLFFEVLLPLHPFWSQWATADPADILCYWTGGLVAAMVWRWTLPPVAAENSNCTQTNHLVQVEPISGEQQGATFASSPRRWGSRFGDRVARSLDSCLRRNDGLRTWSSDSKNARDAHAG